MGVAWKPSSLVPCVRIQHLADTRGEPGKPWAPEPKPKTGGARTKHGNSPGKRVGSSRSDHPETRVRKMPQVSNGPKQAKPTPEPELREF